VGTGSTVTSANTLPNKTHQWQDAANMVKKEDQGMSKK
jgi:hypothetical protein